MNIWMESSRRGAPEGEGRPALPPPALLENPVLSLLKLDIFIAPLKRTVLLTFKSYHLELFGKKRSE